ncbi:MAG: pca operon transcription factor PcaQ [Proteobacteria bacterium]|nr:pca operon transcription factor PcaQ [Pseudomonadota bacterium]
MSETRVRLRHLQCFLTVAQHRGVCRAAAALSVTQPALSKTLRELEHALGVQLFDRERTGMTLTRFGEIFLQHAAASIASLRHGVDSVRMARSKGCFGVAVGVLPNVAALIMPTAVHRFKQEAPATNVKVVSGDNSRLMDLLRMGEIELVVGRLAQREQMIGLTFEHLYSERLTAVVRPGHPLAPPAQFEPASMGMYPFVIPYRDTTIRHEVDRFLIAQGIAMPANIVETTVIAFSRGYIQFDAIWFAPRGAVESEVREGRLIELPIDNRMMEGPVGLTTRATVAPTPAAQLMIDVVRKVCRAAAGLDNNPLDMQPAGNTMPRHPRPRVRHATRKTSTKAR